MASSRPQRDAGRRHRLGGGADQVEPAAALRPVEQAVAQGLHAAAHLLDEAGREGLVDQPSQAGVVRRVPVEHGARQRAEEGGHPPLAGLLLRRQRVQRALGEAVVLQDGGHVVVARHQPGGPTVG
jgi:hypothetical protein